MWGNRSMFVVFSITLLAFMTSSEDCDPCNIFIYGECDYHCVDNPTSRREDTTDLTESLPDGLEVKKSGIAGAGMGVFATQSFPMGTAFGPYGGEIVMADTNTQNMDEGYMWEISGEDSKILHYIDGKDVKKSNWMRYVNCARNKREQNVIVFQWYQNMYYKTFKDITPGTEMLVWYGVEYAKELGIISITEHIERDINDKLNTKKKIANADPGFVANANVDDVASNSQANGDDVQRSSIEGAM